MARNPVADTPLEDEAVGLDAQSVERIARRVADILREETSAPTEPWLTAADVADRYSVSRTWVYDNAELLGVVRLGTGRKAGRGSIPPASVSTSRKTIGGTNRRQAIDGRHVVGWRRLISFRSVATETTSLMKGAAMAQKGRPPTGQIRRYPRADGQTTFSLRVYAYGERHTVSLGNERDGWNEMRADIELSNVLAQITAGIWEPPPKRGEKPDQPPTFHEYASMWLKRRVVEGIKNNTRKDYLWQLSNHLLPFLGSYRVDEIDHSLVEQFKDAKLDERARIVAAQENGIRLRGGDGRVLHPLSNTSINKFLILLTRILEAAWKHGWVEDNAAAHVERLKVRRRKGAILEADELESLIAAADPAPHGAAQTPARRAEVQRLRDDERLSWREIATALGIASSTAVYLYRSEPAKPKSDSRRG